MDMDQDPAAREWVVHMAQVWEVHTDTAQVWVAPEWDLVDREWVAALGDHLHRQEEADVDAA